MHFNVYLIQVWPRLNLMSLPGSSVQRFIIASDSCFMFSCFLLSCVVLVLCSCCVKCCLVSCYFVQCGVLFQFFCEQCFAMDLTTTFVERENRVVVKIPQRQILETTLAELIEMFCFGSYSYFWLNFFVVTSFDPYFVGKIARAFSLVRFESSKKVANFIFVKTSNGHNFCSGNQNRYYFICIWGRKKFPTL